MRKNINIVEVRYLTKGGHPRIVTDKLNGRSKSKALAELKIYCRSQSDFNKLLHEETPEQAADKYVEHPYKSSYKDYVLTDSVRTAFLAGVKWARRKKY